MRAMTFWLTVTVITKCNASMVKMVIKPVSFYQETVAQKQKCRIHSVFFCPCFLASTEVQFYLINSYYPVHLSFSPKLINEWPQSLGEYPVSVCYIKVNHTESVLGFPVMDVGVSASKREPTFGEGTDPS